MLEFNANINNILFVVVKLSVLWAAHKKKAGREGEPFYLHDCMLPSSGRIYSLQPCKALTLMSTCAIL